MQLKERFKIFVIAKSNESITTTLQFLLKQGIPVHGLSRPRYSKANQTFAALGVPYEIRPPNESFTPFAAAHSGIYNIFVYGDIPFTDQKAFDLLKKTLTIGRSPAIVLREGETLNSSPYYRDGHVTFDSFSSSREELICMYGFIGNEFKSSRYLRRDKRESQIVPAQDVSIIFSED